MFIYDPEYNESQWLSSSSPAGLASSIRLYNKRRCGHLFIEWGNKIRHLHEPPDRQLFDELTRWILGRVDKPDLSDKNSSRFQLDNAREDIKDARRFCEAMGADEIGLASAYAAVSYSEHYPDFEYAESLPDPSVMGRKRNTVELDRRLNLVIEESNRRVKWWKERESHRLGVLREFCDQFRDVAGNPFRPVALDRRWQTDSVVQLANSIDASGRYDLMPILADALQEADCESEELLRHCREDKVHVRGCWAVDLLLGRM